MSNSSNSSNEKVSAGTNTPRREAIAINGTELAQIILGSIAQRLLNTMYLDELLAYPGARVQFACKITPRGLEEAGSRLPAWTEDFTLDFSNPPDVVRILSGLPVWEQFKVQLAKFVQMNERPVEAGEGLRKAALQVATGIVDTPTPTPVSTEPKLAMTRPTTGAKLVGGMK